jgi:hypothetical protein
MIADISELSSDAAWWSSVDHWALAFVAIGVVIEGIGEWLPKERRERPLVSRIMRTGWLILVLALAIEYTAQRNKDADDALIVVQLDKGRQELIAANLDLKAKFAWRRLDKDQILQIIAELLPYQNIPYDMNVSDAESFSLLVDMSKAFTAPALHWVGKSAPARIGIRTDDGTVIGVGVIHLTDVRIMYGIARESDFGPAARALASALNAAGIKAMAEVEPTEKETMADQRMHIIVGAKPLL